jgi:hypothetical protein
MFKPENRKPTFPEHAPRRTPAVSDRTSANGIASGGKPGGEPPGIRYPLSYLILSLSKDDWQVGGRDLVVRQAHHEVS